MASEYYDMRYFRFFASHTDEENRPENVQIQNKKWTTGDAQKAGDYFIIDMYEELEAGKVVLTQPQDEYPGKYSVYISNKMEDFGEPILVGIMGKESEKTVIDFPEIKNIRFIKIILEEGTEENTNAWSISSLLVYHANSASSKLQSKKAENRIFPDITEIHAGIEKKIGMDIDSFDGTRASFAALLAAFSKRTIASSVSGTYYTDVKSSTNRAPEIEAISDFAECSKFYPDDKIILDDAIEWIINALGYNKVAHYAGEGKQGYKNLASSLGLLKNVRCAYGQELDVTALIELFYNALMTPILAVGDTTDHTKYDLAAYIWHDIIEITGNVVSNGYTSRSGAALVSGNRVMIGDEVYFDEEGFASDYIGLNIVAYIKARGTVGRDSSVIYAAPQSNKNSVTVIPGQNVISGDLSGIKYYVDLDRSNTRRIAFDQHPDMIYNGRGCTPFKEDKLSGIKNGYLTVVDSDNNGRIDLVIVEEYVDYFVSYIDRNKMTFSDMYGNVSISISEDDVQSAVILRNGERISFGDIKPKSVISVSADVTSIDASGIVRIDENNSSIYKLYVSDKAFGGTVTSISDELYTVDGIEFKRGVYLDSAIASGNAVSPILGQNYTFYVNYMDEIAAVEALADTSVNYGLLVKVRNNRQKEQVEMNIITTTGKLQEFAAAQKVRVDGVKDKFDIDKAKLLFYDNVSSDVYDSATSSVITVTNYQLVPQVIGYTQNKDSEIVSIDTKNYNAAYEDKYATIRHQEPQQYTCNIYRGMIYPTASTTAPNMNYGKAILFVGPSNVAEADISSDYEVYGGTYFQQDAKYKLEIFKHSEFNSLEIGFLHDGASGSSSSTSDEYVLVNKTVTCLNKDDEVVTRIEGIQGGKRFAADLYSDDVLQGLTLKQGDLIAVGMNQRGQIIKVKSIFDVSNKNSVSLSNNGKYYQERRTTVGKVYKASGSSVMVTSTKAVTDSDVESAIELFNLSSTAMVYDEANKEVRSATSGDIKAYKGVHSDSKTSLVFILTTWGENRSFVIYNFE